MTPGEDPERTRELASLELTRGLAIQMSAIGTIGFVVAWAALSAVYQATTGQPVGFEVVTVGVNWWTHALNLLVLVLLSTGFIVPHEWLHGLAIRYYGGEPRYGVGIAHFILPYAYATTDHVFSRNQFIVVLLTPLVVLTIVGVPVMVIFEWGWLSIPLALNIAGAVADAWMALMVASYPSHVRIEDHEAGVRILGRSADRPGSLPATTLVWDALSGTAVAAIGSLVLLAIGGPIALSMLGVDSITVGNPGTITYLFSFAETETELSFGVGPGVLVLGAAIGLGYALVRSYRSERRSNTEIDEPMGGP